MLKRNWQTIFELITLLFDVAAIVVGFVFAYFVRFSNSVPFESFFVEYKLLGIYSLIVFFIFAVLLGLYRESFRSELRHQYVTAAKVFAYSLIIIPALLYLLQDIYHSRIFIALFYGSIPFFFLLSRLALNKINIFMQNKGYGIQNAIILGLSKNVEKRNRIFESFPELGYKIDRTFTKQKSSNGNIEHVYSKQLIESIKQKNINHIFLTESNYTETEISEIIKIASKNNAEVKILTEELDEVLSSSKIHDVTGISLYKPKKYRVDIINKALKRIFDIVASAIIIIIILPLLLFISLLIFIESGWKGSIIFKHKRAAAYNSKTFYFYKFRSMVIDADELKNQLYSLNESNGALFKIKDDPRVTKVGKFIRKWSIDELPQLFNVLKGDMSLVGPRPLCIPDFEKIDHNNLIQKFYSKRAEVKPGITGLWQVSGRSKLGFEEMILLDLYYIENQSVLFDIEILFETIPVVLFGKGAF